jgi:transposase
MTSLSQVKRSPAISGRLNRTGYVLVYKRLSEGRLSLPTRPLPGRQHVEIDPAQLMLMLEGIELRGARQRRRYRRVA